MRHADLQSARGSFTDTCRCLGFHSAPKRSCAIRHVLTAHEDTLVEHVIIFNRHRSKAGKLLDCLLESSQADRSRPLQLNLD
jgi:hypothetical protein